MRNARMELFMTFSILMCLGVVMIYSSSGIYALEVMHNSSHFLTRHLMFLGIGTALMLGVMLMDYRLLRKWARPIMVVVIVLLVLVLVPGIGKISSGARRWFNLGPINFQPSEMAKVGLIIYLADYCARKQGLLRNLWKGFCPALLVMGLLSVLIMKQPDMGNTVLVFLITMTMLFIAGARIKHLVSIFLPAIPLVVLLVLLEPYRIRRVVAFLNPWEDPQGAGFQLSQSQIALGSGGFWGVGLGQSEQKLLYLPAAHTDFIFSIIGEELGFLGALAVIGLFALFIWQVIRILKQIVDPFGYYLIFGFLMMLGIQVVVNFGVSIGALPTKGLPLPFISYGGSALIFNMMAVGLILNISRTQDLGSA
ncbi:MAG: putative lipid II flippase FtsW [Candidatus Omnitrophica bacterium]|nr:putative lipid II flippase FtsW [Candidatus Omnitrophota bacterium]